MLVANELHGFEEIAAAITDMNPAFPCRHEADALDAGAPQLGFLVGAAGTFGIGLVGWLGLAFEELLEDESEDLLAIGVEGDTVVLQESDAIAGADRPQVGLTSPNSCSIQSRLLMGCTVFIFLTSAASRSSWGTLPSLPISGLQTGLRVGLRILPVTNFGAGVI